MDEKTRALPGVEQIRPEETNITNRRGHPHPDFLNKLVVASLPEGAGGTALKQSLC